MTNLKRAWLGGIKRVARATGITTLLTLLLFILLEGVSSTVIFVRDFAWRAGLEGGASARSQPGGVSSQHTQPDEDLGWAHLPNVNIPDLYGPGRHFRTNSQGFRNDSDFTTEEPEGRVRLICSGDSFTLGYGVSNADAWCTQLATLDPRLETINMGQVAYGLGQAYLWYRRDGARLEHSVHVLAFITADIARMRRDDFQGIEKPRLELENGILVARNIPIRQGGLFPLSSERRAVIRNLSTMRAANAILRRLGPSTAGRNGELGEPGAAAADLPDSESRAIVDGIIAELLRENRESGRLLVLLHLPVRSDYRAEHVIRTEYGHESSGAWRRYLAEQAPTRGFVFIDMVESLGALTSDEFGQMFLPRSSEGAGRGHLSELGNRHVARLVYERLRRVDDLSDRLTPAAP
jgi:hypothetical protein